MMQNYLQDISPYDVLLLAFLFASWEYWNRYLKSIYWRAFNVRYPTIYFWGATTIILVILSTAIKWSQIELTDVNNFLVHLSFIVGAHALLTIVPLIVKWGVLKSESVKVPYWAVLLICITLLVLSVVVAYISLS